MARRAPWWLLVALPGLACGGASPSATLPAWRVVSESDAAALLSVSGTSARDVWLVGADDGSGPLVLHDDGAGFQRQDTGVRADLWWVQALPEGLVYAGGSAGTVLERRAGIWTRLTTPAAGDHTVFGVWAAPDGDVYAVGLADGSGGFLWHHADGAFRELPLPVDLSLDERGHAPGLFKVWGATGSDVWVVGERGTVLRGNAREGFVRVPSGSSEERLFTVHGAGAHVAMVGGLANGWALEQDGERLVDISPPGAGPLQGVCWSESGALWAVGVGGAVYLRAAGSAEWRDAFPERPVQSLHAVWVDPRGGVWAVGGNVLTPELDRGVALHLSPSGG